MHVLCWGSFSFGTGSDYTKTLLVASLEENKSWAEDPSPDTLSPSSAPLAPCNPLYFSVPEVQQSALTPSPPQPF